MSPAASSIGKQISPATFLFVDNFLDFGQAVYPTNSGVWHIQNDVSGTSLTFSSLSFFFFF
jgi:hypothetical protein